MKKAFVKPEFKCILIHNDVLTASFFDPDQDPGMQGENPQGQGNH